MNASPQVLVSLQVVLLVLLGGYWLASSLASRGALAAANAGLPAAMGVACAACAFQMVRRSKISLLTPVPWFLLTSAGYFGIGPLLQVFGSQTSIDYAAAFYPVSPEALFRTNLLNIACILTTVASYWLLGRSTLIRFLGERLRMGEVSERRWLKVFITVGVAVKYLLYLPYAFGLLQFVPPSSFMVFSIFLSAAILMVSRNVFIGRLRFLPLFLILTGLELVAGVLTFSKWEALVVLVFVGVGAYLGRPTRKVAVSVVLVTIGAYLLLIPLVNFGRRAVGVSGSASDRGATALGFVSGRSVPPEDSSIGVQGWWTRLSYANVQAFAMEAYDGGAAGTSLQAIPMSLVPRFLWPGKPIVTIGDQLTYLITGSSTSMSSPTSFGEGYWNGGWLGALGVAFWMGFVFRFFQALSLGQLARGNFGALPFAALGMLMGLRPDDWFGPTYVGGFAITLAVYASCMALASVLRGGR